MVPSDPSRVQLTDGVLELNDTTVKFPEILAKDIILRAKIKRLDRDKHLTLNVRDSAEGGYLGYHSYNAVGKWVGIAKWQGVWKDSIKANHARHLPGLRDEVFERREGAVKGGLRRREPRSGTACRAVAQRRRNSANAGWLQ